MNKSTPQQAAFGIESPLDDIKNRRIQQQRTRLNGIVDVLQEEPWKYGLFQAMRFFEALSPDMPRLGESPSPRGEPVKLAQYISLAFAPSSVAKVSLSTSGKPRIEQYVYGLLGVNGPMPIHLTEYTRERILHHRDVTLSRFLDLFNNRLTLLFYRAWAQAQPVISLDRPDDSRFSKYLGTLFGASGESSKNKDALPDYAKYFFAGRLSNQTRNAEGLSNWIRDYFRIQAQVLVYQAHWMTLPKSLRSRLGQRETSCLGQGAVLGASVWDVQHRFRIRLGPLNWQQFRGFLPSERGMARLTAMVRNYAGLELKWDVQICLTQKEVPRLHLDQATREQQIGRLGRSSWLGVYRKPHDDEQLIVQLV